MSQRSNVHSIDIIRSLRWSEEAGDAILVVFKTYLFSLIVLDRIYKLYFYCLNNNIVLKNNLNIIVENK